MELVATHFAAQHPSQIVVANRTLERGESLAKKWAADEEKNSRALKAEKAKKGPGLMQRMNEAAEAKKQLMEKGPQQPNPASRQNNRKPK